MIAQKFIFKYANFNDSLNETFAKISLVLIS